MSVDIDHTHFLYLFKNRTFSIISRFFQLFVVLHRPHEFGCLVKPCGQYYRQCLSVFLVVCYKIRAGKEVERHKCQENVQRGIFLLVSAHVRIKLSRKGIGKVLSDGSEKQWIKRFNTIFTFIFLQKLT